MVSSIRIFPLRHLRGEMVDMLDSKSRAKKRGGGCRKLFVDTILGGETLFTLLDR